MVDMGELRALDARPDGSARRVGLLNAKRELKRTVEIASRAGATSAGAETTFDTLRRFTHIFDPRTGSARPTWSSVSVLARTATVADGLSTAFSVLPSESIRRVASRLQDVEVYVSEKDDRIRTL